MTFSACLIRGPTPVVDLFVLTVLFPALSDAGTEPLPDAQVQNLFEILEEEQSLEPFTLGEFVPSSTQHFSPTTTVFEVTA